VHVKPVALRVEASITHLDLAYIIYLMSVIAAGKLVPVTTTCLVDSLKVKPVTSP
jgi:hypothetical protein